MRLRKSKVLVTRVLAALVVAGCGAQNEPPSRGDTVGATEERLTFDDISGADEITQPTPIASLSLPNGNNVGFYVFGAEAFVTELGKAYSQPVTTTIPMEMRRSDRLVDTWRFLAPNEPVPAALVDAQERIVQVSKSASQEARLSPAPTLGSIARPRSSGDVGMTTDTLYGCSNGCCDPNWLFTFGACHDNNPLFLFNYLWSGVDSVGTIWSFEGMTCAAVGWSHYIVSVEGHLNAWWVPEAHYQTFLWYAAYSWTWYGLDWDEKRVTGWVNTDSAQNLHTQCASFWY